MSGNAIDIGGKLLTIKEVLEISKVSRFTLHRDIKSGKLDAIYIGRNVRIKESDAIAYAKEKANSKSVAYYRSEDETHGT